MDEDGFYVGQLESSGRRGLVPSNFLRELPRSNIEESPRSPLNGDRRDSNYDTRRKPLYGGRQTPSRPTKETRSRGGGSRSRLQSDEPDLDTTAPRRRRIGRTRDVRSDWRVHLSIYRSLDWPLTWQDLPRQLSRGHSHGDDHEDAEEEEEEEDSMITSTVPPANPSEWVESSDTKAGHANIPIHSMSTSVPNTTALMPPTLNEAGSIRGGGTDVDIGKESPESDGQGGLIFMDINSKKHSKVSERIFLRNRSLEICL